MGCMMKMTTMRETRKNMMMGERHGDSRINSGGLKDGREKLNIERVPW